MTITSLITHDIRFPTSLQQDGSDALNLGDYSATYAVLGTDAGLEGHGLTFTNGRGNEIVVAAVHALTHHVLGRRLDDIVTHMRAFYRDLTVDKQLRWLGPEKGILHMRWDVDEAITRMHFVDPCITSRDRYVAPVRPGCSIEIRAQSLTDYAFPQGSVRAGHGR